MKKTIVFIVLIIVICIAGGIGGYYIKTDPYKNLQKNVIEDSHTESLPEILADTEDEPLYLDWSDLSWHGPDESDDYIESIMSEKILPYDEDILYSDNLSFLVELSEPQYAIKLKNRLDSKKIIQGKMFINNVLSYTGRKNDLLLSMYARFRNTLFDIISKERFYELRIQEMISLLNSAYYDHFQYYDDDNNLNEEYLQEVYNALCYNSDMELIIPTLSGYDDEPTESECFWAYSFWARRYAENNIPAVRAILDDLRAHYMYDEEIKINPDSYYDEPRPVNENGDYTYAQYFPDSTLMCTYQYDIYGKRTGQWIYYFHGKKEEECWMEDDKINGEHREYYEGYYVSSRTEFSNDSISFHRLYHMSQDSTEKTVVYRWVDGRLE